MRQEYGENLRISIYGESHSDEIDVRVTGFPAGSEFDRAELAAFMARRAPGKKGTDALADAAATPRKEPDAVVLREGVIEKEGTACELTGEPFRACIYNTNRRSGDYDELRKVLRPGHADLGAYLRDGAEGLRPGGGRFSGRMTAPMCIAGGIALQLLQQQGIHIHAEYIEIGGETEPERIRDALIQAHEEQDSLGGIVACTVSGFPGGIGGALYEGLEGVIASAIFAIPAVKGIEFGSGFDGSRRRGSQNNDPIRLIDGKLRTETNNAGGINGGISNGMDICFRVAFKPTPTIGRAQRTVNIEKMEEVILQAGGRHDVCVVLRALPVVEAAAGIALLDVLLGENHPSREEETNAEEICCHR